MDGHPFGALLARVTAAGETRFVGVSHSVKSQESGRLHLAINDNAHWQNNLGSYTVKIALANVFDLGAAI